MVTVDKNLKNKIRIMDKKYVFIIFALIFSNVFLATVKAEQVLFLMFTMYKNDTVIVNDLQVTDAPVLLPEDKGNYKIEIADTSDKTIFSTRMDVQFLILSDPPTETNESLVLVKVSWNEQMSKVNFYHADKLIHTIELCNKDNQCESSKGENTINCPQDCRLTTTIPTTTTLPTGKPKTSIFIYIIIIAIVIAVAVLFLLRIRVVR